MTSSRAVRIGTCEVSTTDPGGHPVGEADGSVGNDKVTADGEGLVSHASAALLVKLADRVGLTGAVGRVGRHSAAPFGA
jgi:hypothetical protein